LDNFKAGMIKTFPVVAKKLSHQNHCPAIDNNDFVPNLSSRLEIVNRLSKFFQKALELFNSLSESAKYKAHNTPHSINFMFFCYKNYAKIILV